MFGGAYYRRYFCVSDLGGFYTEGLIHEGAYFRNFTVSSYIRIYCVLIDRVEGPDGNIFGSKS